MRESAATEAESLVSVKEQKPTTKTPVKNKPEKKEPEEKFKKKKNLGGRPKNSELGLACRKQYSLTLEENTYQTFLDMARKEKLSFAKFMEKAAYEYIENNK